MEDSRSIKSNLNELIQHAARLSGNATKLGVHVGTRDVTQLQVLLIEKDKEIAQYKLQLEQAETALRGLVERHSATNIASTDVPRTSAHRSLG